MNPSSDYQMISARRRCVDILCVPTEAGTHWPGQCKAPEAAIKTGGLVSKLVSHQFEVTVHDRVFSNVVYTKAARWRPALKQNGVRNEENTLTVMHAVRNYLRNNGDSLVDTFPIVLGGDCSITPTVFSGLSGLYPATTRIGLLYIDGDVDLTLPEQTDADGSTSILDSMTISHLTGRPGGLDSMRAFARPDGTPAINPSNVVLFGFDPLQPATEHWTYLLENGFKALTCPTVRFNPIARAGEAIAWLRQKVDVVYVHFDVDVIDSGEFPLANYPRYNGLSVGDTLDVLREVLSHDVVCGLTITEMNPNNDPDGKMICQIVDGVVEGMAGRKT